MNCSNCGAQNSPDSKFCIECGSALNNTTQNNMINNQQPSMENIPPVMSNEQTIPTQQTSVNMAANTATEVANNAPLNYIQYLISILIKPFQGFNNEKSKLNNSKNSLILTLIVTIVMTLSTLIRTIINTVHVKNFSFLSDSTYSWEFSRLKDINYLEVVGKNFLIYAGIILAIAIVFYLGSLIIKKQMDFFKSLSISASAAIPAVIASMILSPILTLIWAQLGIFVSIFGFVYSVLILYELINSELKLENDLKIYFNVICFGLLLSIAYYVGMKLIMSSVTSSIGNVLDYFD